MYDEPDVYVLYTIFGQKGTLDDSITLLFSLLIGLY